jgi:hypothetical protein
MELWQVCRVVPGVDAAPGRTTSNVLPLKPRNPTVERPSRHGGWRSTMIM